MRPKKPQTETVRKFLKKKKEGKPSAPGSCHFGALGGLDLRNSEGERGCFCNLNLVRKDLETLTLTDRIAPDWTKRDLIHVVTPMNLALNA